MEMTPATATPDLVLAVRLDALLKNFEQIRDSRRAVEARSKEVLDLRRLAKGEQESVDREFEDLEIDAATALRRVSGLRDCAPAARLERPIEDLKNVVEALERSRQKFADMLATIEQMAERWEQIASARLETLEQTLVFESDMRIAKTRSFQRDLDGQDEPSTARAQIWDEYEDLAYRDGERLFAEYVDFMGGVALRNTGIDHGVCQMADDLMGRLYRIGASELFHSMTLPTRREASTKTIARIIRLGFPEWTVWAVPLGAHEFGHLALTENTELRQAVHEHRRTSSLPNGDVLLADAFATSVMGPAYAYAAVLLSLDPCKLAPDERAAARTESGGPACAHASPDSARTHVILRTLELMAETTADYQDVRDMLCEAWERTLGAFDLRFDLGGLAADLDDAAAFMHGFLSERARHLMYRPTRYAEIGAWPSLLAGEADAAFAELLGEMGVRDVLNLAWRERMAHPDHATGRHADRLADAALELWRTRYEQPRAGNARPAASWSQPMRGGV